MMDTFKRWIKKYLKRVYAYFFLKFSNPVSVKYQNNDLVLDSPYTPPENNPAYQKETHPDIPDSTLKLLAFYLPQFHPVPENDRFWGKGFTEWHNVARALPLFPGHYQPRLPGELGFYDLRVEEVMARQIELARQYGIYGFCFHHYFLNNKAVLRDPLNLFLKNKQLNFPFCLHWANEPWTVRWDGEREMGGILIDQTHDDNENRKFIEDALPALRDERYIRIEGKPMLLIYRPSLFPDFRKTADAWRNFCRANGLGGLYLIMVRTFFDPAKNPEKYGCDAAVEFPPHKGFCVSKKMKVPFYISNFEGEIFDYRSMAAFSMVQKPPPYTLFRGVMSGWDNTARTKAAKIYYGSSPEIYQQWLAKLAKYTRENLPADRQLIFINAWNEWGEGAYLEPDRKYGYAYLNATARALIEESEK